MTPLYQKDPGFKNSDEMLYCVLSPEVTEDAFVNTHYDELIEEASAAFKFQVNIAEAHLCRHEATGASVIVVIFEPIKTKYVM